MQINIAPNWTATGKILALAIRHGTAEGRELAAQEVERMGALIDMLGAAPDAAAADPDAAAADPEWAECGTISDTIRMRYLSNALPAGYDTVLGYIARHSPWSLDYDMWDASATQRDGYWLKHRANERGIAVVKVPAPPVLEEQGIKMVNAYPVSLLTERLGD